MELKKLYRNTLEVSKNLKTLTAIAGEKNKEELADLNVEQMNEGLLSTGNKITPKYSKSYAAFKGFTTPNVKVTGTYHSSIFTERKGDRMLFDSNDSDTDKKDFLEDHYTQDLYGIAPKNEQKDADIREPELFILVENGLKKGIL